VTDWWTFWI